MDNVLCIALILLISVAFLATVLNHVELKKKYRELEEKLDTWDTLKSPKAGKYVKGRTVRR